MSLVPAQAPQMWKKEAGERGKQRDGTGRRTQPDAASCGDRGRTHRRRKAGVAFLSRSWKGLARDFFSLECPEGM